MNIEFNVDRQALVTIVVVLLLLSSQAAIALGGTLTHSATSGVTYETNAGLTVTLADDRDVEASPFSGDETFADHGVRISSPGDAAATLSDDTYGGDTMTVGGLDASTNPITIERDDGLGPITMSGGASSIILHDIEVDNGEVDFELAAGSETTIVVPNVPDLDGIQAVDADGEAVAGTTDTSDNTAELTFDAGTYEIRLQDGPSTLDIRDLTNQALVTEDEEGNPIEVEVEFFGSDGAVEQRSTTDGTIDMTGLPADERFAVTVDGGDEFVTRQAIIPSLLNQQTAWLLPQTTEIETVEPRFTLADPSNQFDEERSEVVLERPIDRGDGTEFVAVAGDRIGINGFDAILERDQRYRVVVTDPETGAQRELGEFTPTQSEPVTLTVEDIEFDSVAEVEGLEWTARYVDREDDTDQIEFIFRDVFETESLSYRIFERGDRDNVLTSGSATDNVTVVETVPPGEESTVWTVEWESTRANGEELSATRPVSTDQLPVGPAALPERWQIIISMLALFGVAGLFGAANPGLGGIVVASTGGLLWMVGWLPDETGGLMVLVALFIGVLSYAGRKARGATA